MDRPKNNQDNTVKRVWSNVRHYTRESEEEGFPGGEICRDCDNTFHTTSRGKYSGQSFDGEASQAVKLL
jgi:hypothetical protein